MARIAIVTDSTSDLPRELAQTNCIHVVPLFVHFGEESFRDQVDITADEFYSKLKTSPVIPRSSQPSPADFQSVYEKLLADHDYIFSVHISSKLSGTYQSAVLAKEMLAPDKIEPVDTGQASIGTGLVALAAASAAAEDGDVQKVRSTIERVSKELNTIFSVDTLVYLEKNGRIGKAQAFLGGLLSIKPILGIENGVVVPVEKLRGAGKVIPRLVELVREKSGGKRPLKAAVVHARALERAEALKAELLKAGDVTECIIAECGPIIGTHTGPGTLGVVWYPVA